MNCRPSLRSARYTGIQMTVIVGKQIRLTKIGQTVMKRIGDCIAEGGAVTFREYIKRQVSFADVTLSWEQDNDNDGAGQQRQRLIDDRHEPDAV